MKKLLIITDTEYYLDTKNRLSLFHSVFNEMGSIQFEFETQELVGVRISENRNQFLESKSGLKAIGANSFRFGNLRIKLIWTALIGILELIKPNSAKYIHVRGPSIVMFVILIIAPFFPKKKFWFKYANVWNETGRSYFWDLQKWILKKNANIKVTINGKWDHLPKHILPFENPCFFNSDLTKYDLLNKDWSGSKKLIFVGRITEDKGVFRILNALKGDFFEMVFVGNGKDLMKLETEIQNHPLRDKIKIFGEASKETVMKLLSEAHLLLLPTTSPEGFPKVISEAWLKKCIPVTSDISSIPHYVIEGKTGFIWNRKSENWESAFDRAMKLNSDNYMSMEAEIKDLLPKFTYEYFGERIVKEVFCSEA